MHRRVDEKDAQDSQGKKTNPSSGTVLADTDSVAHKPGTYEVFVLVGATVACWVQLEHRNSANDAHVDDPIGIRVPADAPAQFLWGYFLQSTERVRVTVESTITGDVWASVRIQRVG